MQMDSAWGENEQRGEETCPPVPGIAREHLLAVVQQQTAAEDSFDFQCCCGF